ncbi:MAG: outer membrane lipoprotein carrier protein LolA [Saprospiraceae bacterium]|nr:outer membrane lipoprotein carrier protein LolA [Saprospiraceae bacterium]
MIFSLIGILSNLFVLFNPDTKAITILDKTQSQYKKMGGMEIFFDYEQIEKGKSTGQNKGQLLSKDHKYRLILKDFEIYNNSKTQYTYLKRNKEVQITNPEESDNKYQPSQLAAIHKAGTHQAKYIKLNKTKGKNNHVIELIPLSKDETISKITLFISEKSNLIEKAEWLESGGSKTIVVFTKTVASKLIDDAAFELNTNALKGVHIEDLREE